jgi:hypothetical protein
MKKKRLQHMEEPSVLSESFSEIQQDFFLATRKMGTHEAVLSIEFESKILNKEGGKTLENWMSPGTIKRKRENGRHFWKICDPKAATRRLMGDCKSQWPHQLIELRWQEDIVRK